MRAIWKGHIRFSLVTIPIRVYNAVDTEQKIGFNQIHRECNGPVGYDKRCKKCSKVVTKDDIVKGYQYEPDQYVIVEPQDLDKIKLKSTKVIEIAGFISTKEVTPMLYESPYFAGPDGPVAAKAYALLSHTLKETGKVGIGKVVLRDREDVVLIGPMDGGIVLYKLRYPNELKKMGDVPQIEEQKIDKDQLKLARSLVDSMSTTYKKLELNDTYHEALVEMIEAKVQGKEVVTVEEETKPVVDIMTALKQSIEQAKTQRKPMVKATGRKPVQAKQKARRVKAG